MGLGSEILRALLGLASEAGCSRVEVHSGRRAVAFYERAGFEHFPQLMNHRLDDSEARRAYARSRACRAGRHHSLYDRLLLEVGGRILWRTAVLGHVVGTQAVDEAIGIWYPSHQSFLILMSAPSSGENMRLRSLAVEQADLHRCRPY